MMAIVDPSGQYPRWARREASRRRDGDEGHALVVAEVRKACNELAFSLPNDDGWPLTAR